MLVIPKFQQTFEYVYHPWIVFIYFTMMYCNLVLRVLLSITRRMDEAQTLRGVYYILEDVIMHRAICTSLNMCI